MFVARPQEATNKRTPWVWFQMKSEEEKKLVTQGGIVYDINCKIYLVR